MQNDFKSNHNLTPIIGAEIEFYLSENIDVRELASKIGHDIKLEKGKKPFEGKVKEIETKIKSN